MARIPVFGFGVQSRSRAVTAARTQNIYVERRPAGEKSQIVGYGTPGLDLEGTAGDTPWRGAIPVETTDFWYGVHRGTFYQVDNTGTLTSRGTLNTTSGRVWLSHNGTKVLMTDGTNAYLYTISGASFSGPISSNIIANTTTCTWQDQWFIVGSPAAFQISADGSTWNAADVGIPESNPDGLVATVSDHGELILPGKLSTEFWTNTGATDFPFAPLKSSTAEWGCASDSSITKFNDSLAWLGKNRLGQVSVVKLEGYIPRVISTPDIDFIINGYADVSDATAFSYMLGGHPMYQINFPAAGYSWLYDGKENHWSPAKSYGMTRQRCDMAISYLNKTIVFDESNGDFYSLNPNTYTENGDLIERELISENVALPDLERFSVDRFRVDIETGVGTATGQGSDPQIMLQVSHDAGNSWGAEMWQSMGPIGQFKQRVEWLQLGASDQFTFKVRVTDPVKFAMVSAMINPPD